MQLPCAKSVWLRQNPFSYHPHLQSRRHSILALNLEIKSDRDLFEQDYDVHELISAIHLYLKKTVNTTGRTLLFIDEIQNSPKAASILRYFFEERNDIHVIAAGSLLETLILLNLPYYLIGELNYYLQEFVS